MQFPGTLLAQIPKGLLPTISDHLMVMNKMARSPVTSEEATSLILAGETLGFSIFVRTGPSLVIHHGQTSLDQERGEQSTTVDGSGLPDGNRFSRSSMSSVIGYIPDKPKANLELLAHDLTIQYDLLIFDLRTVFKIFLGRFSDRALARRKTKEYLVAVCEKNVIPEKELKEYLASQNKLLGEDLNEAIDLL